MDSKVTIIDSMCGTGKTSWAIQEMNNNLDKKYIYITPFLTEVERVIDSCFNRSFEQPNVRNGKGSKKRHFNKMIEEGRNIISTHALFKSLDKRTAELLQEQGYTLILDEVMNVIENINITADDRMLINDFIQVDENNKVHWVKQYEGVLDGYKQQIINGEVYFHRDKFFLWTFPVTLFESFKEVYVMTYKFKGQYQCYYYQMHNIEFQYKSVQKDGEYYKLVSYQEADTSIYKDLIHICQNKRLNAIGKKRGNLSPLSSSGLKKNRETLYVLQKHLYNYFRHICSSPSKDNAWTIYKDYKKECSGKGYTKGFIPFNIRSTNDYSHKKCFAYCIDLYMNPIIKSFFTDRGIEVDNDEWALAELIQFIFRGAIRNGEEIQLYIPSERMRTLLEEWLNN